MTEYPNYNYQTYFEQFRPDEILVYLRKSRSDDPMLTVEEVLAKHETILNEWSERNIGRLVPEKNKFREVVSGETIADRPEIQKVLKLIESPKIKAILAVEVQRLSRGDLEDAGRLIKLLRYTNTLVITPQKTYNLKDEYDRDAFERELKRGNEFLEYQKKIMNRGRFLSVSQGNYIGSVPPYGYNKVWITDGKRKCPTLAINETEANAVRMIFDLYVNQNMGRTNICYRLDELGIKPPKGERWSQYALKDLLENVHYLGKVKWNWRKEVKAVEDGEVVKTRPKQKFYEIFEGKHEAIISEELFKAAQEKQGRNHRAKPSTKIRNPLASLLYCQCGRAMTLRTYKSRDNKPRLACIDQAHCGTGSCTYDEMLVLVKDMLRKNIVNFEIQLKKENANTLEMHKSIIRNLKKRLKDINSRELSQWESQSSPNPADRMPQEIFRQLNEKLQREKNEVEEALQHAYETIPNPTNYERKIAMFSEALEALQNPNESAEEQNRLLKSCIDRIEYFRESPQRIKRKESEKKGERFKTAGGRWKSFPIELNIKLRV